MRDKRFVAEHRGGPLSIERHRLLIAWACDCAGHVVRLLEGTVDERLRAALDVAREWKKGNASVGDARAASLGAIAAARDSDNSTAIAVARSIGHAVATAHMADHSLGAAWYALKAVNTAGGSTDVERTWQDERLPSGIRSLVLTARKRRSI
jgi:hypothetical protein